MYMQVYVYASRDVFVIALYSFIFISQPDATSSTKDSLNYTVRQNPTHSTYFNNRGTLPFYTSPLHFYTYQVITTGTRTQAHNSYRAKECSSFYQSRVAKTPQTYKPGLEEGCGQQTRKVLLKVPRYPSAGKVGIK